MKEPRPVQAAEQELGEDGIAKLERFIVQAAEAYRNEGIPVADDGRIDNRAYANLYFDEIQEDNDRTAEYEAEWLGAVSDEEKKKERRKKEGEQLEMLSFAIFTKNLPRDEFVVVRSSSHDDRVNKVDTLILDRKTGTLVCAFDEVGATNGKEYDDKLALVHDLNLTKGGASLKYGISSKMEDGKQTVALSSAENIPVFYIALPSKNIKEGMEKFLPDMANQSEYEQGLFSYFVLTISAQIEILELNGRRLNPALREKLTAFKSIMEPIQAGIKKSQAAKKKGK